MRLFFKTFYVCHETSLFLFLLILIKNGNFEQITAKSNTFKLPKIIWWTNFVYPHTADTSKISCGNSQCISSSNSKLKYDDHDIVAYIFYGSDFNGENLPLPRKSNELWCLLHEESPMNNFIFSHSYGIQLFNFTATFSRYSDFPVTTQFLPTIDYLIKRKPVSVTEKNIFRTEGLAPVLYLQSHCNIASDRDRYVKELMKFINVDSYGICLHNKNLPGDLNSTSKYNDEKLLNFISNYKFHIAFENALCEDYITEKFFRPLHVGSVPIYQGSPSIKDWMPSENSIIVADDFESPEHLAKYLKSLDQNDELYESYLTYKNGITNEHVLKVMETRTWGVNDPNRHDFISGFECFICDNLVKIVKEHNYKRIATRKHMNCHQPHLSLGMDLHLPLSDAWVKEGWIDSFWFAFDQGKAIQNMIKNNENSSTFWRYVMQTKYEH